MRITNLNDDYTIEYAPRIYYAFSVNVTLEVWKFEMLQELVVGNLQKPFLQTICNVAESYINKENGNYSVALNSYKRQLLLWDGIFTE